MVKNLKDKWSRKFFREAAARKRKKGQEDELLGHYLHHIRQENAKRARFEQKLMEAEIWWKTLGWPERRENQ